MQSSLAIASAPPQASSTVLRERLAQLEAALLEARGRVILSFDRELASLRGWMDVLERFDPTVGMQTVQESPADARGFIAEPPHAAASNIVPFTSAEFSPAPVIEEPPMDPGLAGATLDELNAALAAAFQQVAER